MWKLEERKSTGKPRRRWKKITKKGELIKTVGMVQKVFMKSRTKNQKRAALTEKMNLPVRRDT
jgi:hypothetical protein